MAYFLIIITIIFPILLVALIEPRCHEYGMHYESRHHKTLQK